MITKTLYITMIVLLIIKVLNIMDISWCFIFMPLFIWLGLVILSLVIIGIIAIVTMENTD